MDDKLKRLKHLADQGALHVAYNDLGIAEVDQMVDTIRDMTKLLAELRPVLEAVADIDQVFEAHAAWLEPFADADYTGVVDHPVLGRPARWDVEYRTEEDFALTVTGIAAGMVEMVTGNRPTDIDWKS